MRDRAGTRGEPRAAERCADRTWTDGDGDGNTAACARIHGNRIHGNRTHGKWTHGRSTHG